MRRPSLRALLPFFIFLGTFISLHIFFLQEPSTLKDNFPLYAALIAIISSFFTFQKKCSLQEKITIFVKGSAQDIVLHMCYIFLFSTIFTHVLDKIGSTQAAVNASLLCIPTWSVLPGMFIVSSLFSLLVGTSMGAIAAFMPIALPIAKHLVISLPLMTATIICGAMFGDNLSILSDTTIAAVNITKANMRRKFSLNLKIALPAFLASLAILTYQNYILHQSMPALQQAAFTMLDGIKIFPYILAFILALLGIDILAVLVLGIFVAIGIGIWQKTFTMLDSINILFNGFYESKGMVNVFILVLLLSGLSKIISYNGGIDYLLHLFNRRLSHKRHAQFVIFILITLVNITIAINTISIIITGPIATKLGNDYDIKPAYTATILDIGSCISQGILPYAPQILLAASIAQISTLAILPYLYYQYLLGISLLCALYWNKK